MKLSYNDAISILRATIYYYENIALPTGWTQERLSGYIDGLKASLKALQVSRKDLKIDE